MHQNEQTASQDHDEFDEAENLSRRGPLHFESIGWRFHAW
jgi:hypothetical protein